MTNDRHWYDARHNGEDMTMGGSTASRIAGVGFSADSKNWRSTIKDLATDLHKPETQIEALFHSEVQQLEKQARVKHFITILAVRRVKEFVQLSDTV